MALQDDFSSLLLPDASQHVLLDHALVDTILVGGKSFCSEDLCIRPLDPSYDPMDCMPDDVLKPPTFTKEGLDLHAVKHLDTDPSMYEPMRRLRSFAPPKRYFTSFWASTAFRLLEKHAVEAKR